MALTWLPIPLRAEITGQLPKLTPASKARRVHRDCLLSIVAVGAVALSYLAPAAYHEIGGMVTGQPHVGHGIHDNWDRVLEHFSEAERRFILDPSSDKTKVIEIFTARLAESYEEKLETKGYDWFPEWRYTADYVRTDSRREGSLCRQEVRVLANFLEHIGLQPEVWQGDQQEFKHAWVEIPSLGLAADPTVGRVTTIPEWRDGFERTKRVNGVQSFLTGTYY